MRICGALAPAECQLDVDTIILDDLTNLADDHYNNNLVFASHSRKIRRTYLSRNVYKFLDRWLSLPKNLHRVNSSVILCCNTENKFWQKYRFAMDTIISKFNHTVDLNKSSISESFLCDEFFFSIALDKANVNFANHSFDPSLINGEKSKYIKHKAYATKIPVEDKKQYVNYLVDMGVHLDWIGYE